MKKNHIIKKNDLDLVVVFYR